MDLYRSLLLTIEDEHGRDGQRSWDIDYSVFADWEPFTCGYHMDLLLTAGLIISEPNFGAPSDPVSYHNVRGITPAGHDLLDSIRDPEIWRQTKDGAAAAGGFTVDLLKTLAKGYLEKKVEAMTGVQL